MLTQAMNQICMQLATASQQAGETARIRQTKKRHSEFRGVHKHSIPNLKKPWFARVTKDGRIYHLGSFASEFAAAIARDKMAEKLFGSSAILNFPEQR